MSYKMRLIPWLVVVCLSFFVSYGLEAEETDREKELLEKIVKIKNGKQ